MVVMWDDERRCYMDLVTQKEISFRSVYGHAAN
jgi:hypothetical protein